MELVEAGVVALAVAAGAMVVAAMILPAEQSEAIEFSRGERRM